MGSRKQKCFDPIAVIGMACRFPGARNVDAFWKNLRHGLESIRPISEQELKAAGISAEVYSRPEYIKARAVLDDIDQFDARLFEFSPREAELTDPQQRVGLECAWEALEQAGYLSGLQATPVGVFTGAAISTYLYELITSGSIDPSNSFRTLLGNDKDHLSTWISYKLNLKGPSLNVQTACSTSLVAVHLACRSLQAYECDLALAGGVSIGHVQHAGYSFEEGGIYSHDGHCRAFDAQSQGSVPGSGVGFVVLKRLGDAEKDRDNILAIVRGSAINNDGAAKVGYTAPSVQGQAEVICAAQEAGGIAPASIDYVEAHGSGTSLGDLIEATALSQVFGCGERPTGPLAIGSVKTNIGHCGQAAGVAGLIKTILALQNEVIPPTLHFARPNPRIDFAGGKLQVNRSAVEWIIEGSPRRAGVSSFGIGGTNAHVILEQAPAPVHFERIRSCELLLLSAKTEEGLERATENLADYLENNPAAEIADVAFTLQAGRRRFEHRRCVVCRNGEDAVQSLKTRDPQRVFTAFRENRKEKVAFLFPGVGDHYPNMALELYEKEPVFRKHMNVCCDFAAKKLNIDLREMLFDPSQRESPSSTTNGTVKLDLRKMLNRGAQQPDMHILQDARAGQPALFALEYALAQMWMSWGVRPDAMMGHSLGEYVAACIAGVFTVEDALTLVAGRANIIQKLPLGAMIAVGLSQEEARAYLSRNVTVAAVMGAAECVLAGPQDAAEKLLDTLAKKGVAARRVQTSHAVHSPMMRPGVSDLVRLCAKIRFSTPKIPFLSNVTGTWISEDEAINPDYWASHLCEPVQLHAGMIELAKEIRCLLEVGPGVLMTSLANQLPKTNPLEGMAALPSLRSFYMEASDTEFLLRTLGQLWLAGVQPDWVAFRANEMRARIPLPGYPFERQSYWIRTAASAKASPVISKEPGPEIRLESEEIAEKATPNLYPTRFLSTPYVAPETMTEETIAELWQELLGVQRIGLHDNFFQIGGTSLLALTVTARLRKAFQIELPITSIFQAPTVAELAVVLEELLLLQLQNPGTDVSIST